MFVPCNQSRKIMKKQFLTGALVMGTLAVGSLGQTSFAEAASISFSVTPFTNDSDPATATFTLTDVAQGVQFNANTNNGDITGIFFDIANNSYLGGLQVTSSNFPFIFDQSGNVSDLGQGVNLNGGGTFSPYEIGVKVGNSGGSPGDFFQSVQFTLSTIPNSGLSPLTINQFLGQNFGLRLQSTSPSGSGSGDGSSKLQGTAVPTPALLPGLIGMGIAALRKKKREEKLEPAGQGVEA